MFGFTKIMAIVNGLVVSLIFHLLSKLHDCRLIENANRKVIITRKKGKLNNCFFKRASYIRYKISVTFRSKNVHLQQLYKQPESRGVSL